MRDVHRVALGGSLAAPCAAGQETTPQMLEWRELEVPVMYVPAPSLTKPPLAVLVAVTVLTDRKRIPAARLYVPNRDHGWPEEIVTGYSPESGVTAGLPPREWSGVMWRIIGAPRATVVIMAHLPTHAVASRSRRG